MTGDRQPVAEVIRYADGADAERDAEIVVSYPCVFAAHVMPVKRTVRSVVRQTERRCEILILCHRDRQFEMRAALQEFDGDERVRVLVLEGEDDEGELENPLGHDDGAILNAVLGAARGGYLVPLIAGDILEQRHAAEIRRSAGSKSPRSTVERRTRHVDLILGNIIATDETTLALLGGDDAAASSGISADTITAAVAELLAEPAMREAVLASAPEELVEHSGKDEYQHFLRVPRARWFGAAFRRDRVRELGGPNPQYGRFAWLEFYVRYIRSVSKSAYLPGMTILRNADVAQSALPHFSCLKAIERDALLAICERELAVERLPALVGSEKTWLKLLNETTAAHQALDVDERSLVQEARLLRMRRDVRRVCEAASTVTPVGRPDVTVIFTVDKLWLPGLTRALQSLVQQECTSFEIVLVHSGQHRLLDELRVVALGDRLRYVYCEEGLLRSDLRNIALRLARGVLITYCDQDTWYQPHHLQRIVRRMQLSGAELCIGAANLDWSGVHPEAGQTMGVEYGEIRRDVYAASNERIRYMPSVALSAVVHKARVANEHALHRDGLYLLDDWMHILYLVSGGTRVAFLPGASVDMRYGGGGGNAVFERGTHEQYLHEYDTVIKRVGGLSAQDACSGVEYRRCLESVGHLWDEAGRNTGAAMRLITSLLANDMDARVCGS